MKTALLFSFLFFIGFTTTTFAQSNHLFTFQSNTSSSVQKKKPKLTIFPNPFVNYIKINDADDLVRQVVVYNLLGKKMKTFTASRGESYNVSNLPRGYYLIQLLGERNKIIRTQRINKR
ncbi:MAG TPA: T9SS type A sorting domain-containing protein [Bacteroidetes bacterium]|nr:T9SS type A sorting domain-containing protein [Bacteroidota bacterium]